MTRTRSRTDGSLALKLDFGSSARHVVRMPPVRPAASLSAEKYRVFEDRRRKAQIAARRLLDLLEGH